MPRFYLDPTERTRQRSYKKDSREARHVQKGIIKLLPLEKSMPKFFEIDTILVHHFSSGAIKWGKGISISEFVTNDLNIENVQDAKLMESVMIKAANLIIRTHKRLRQQIRMSRFYYFRDEPCPDFHRHKFGMHEFTLMAPRSHREFPARIKLFPWLLESDTTINNPTRYKGGILINNRWQYISYTLRPSETKPLSCTRRSVPPLSASIQSLHFTKAIVNTTSWNLQRKD
jgi:hypothetical protein